MQPGPNTVAADDARTDSSITSGINPGEFLYRAPNWRSYEPRPKGRGMIWEEFRTPPKFGFELPGPEGPGFWKPDEKTETTENQI